MFIDLKLLFNAINQGEIIIDDNVNNMKHKPYFYENKAFAILKKNHEDKKGNSSLVIFDVPSLLEIDSNIVFYSEGYLKNIALEDKEQKNLSNIKKITPR